MLKKICYICMFLTIVFLTFGFIGLFSTNGKSFKDEQPTLKSTEPVVESSAIEMETDGDRKLEVPEVQSDSKYNTTFKNDIYYYNQNDYAKSPYGTYGTIKGYGCGPTSMAMILSSFTKSEITPIETTKFACNYGYCSEDGTNSKFFARIAKEYNLKVEGPLDTSDVEMQNKVLRSLESGESLVIMSVADGYFYKGGHYIVLAKSKNGKIRVLDPNSREKTTTYTFDFLMDKEKTNPQYFYIISEEGE